MSSLRYRFVVLAALVLVSGAAVLAQAAPARAAEPVFFGPYQVAPAGAAPTAVAVGDFNGDGKADLVTANRYGYDLSVLLGNGDGSFAAPIHSATDNGAMDVATGDFNGDGKLDVVTANYADDVSVLLGNGDGTFGPHADYATHTISGAVAVGDFNGDGKADLVTANQGSNDVSILFGDGSGGFSAPRNSATGPLPVSVAVGDFNGDGKADLVTANGAHSGSFPYDRVSVLLGNGDGTFGPYVDYAVGGTTIGANPNWVAVADFNKDGIPDVVSANQSWACHDFSILLGQGDGTFAQHVDYPVQTTMWGPYRGAVADLNGDGNLDLAGSVWTDPFHTVAVLLGDGSGGFSASTSFPVGLYPQGLAVADFNGDGRPDIAAANYAIDSVSILLNAGSVDTTLPVVTIISPAANAQYVTGQVVDAAWTVDDPGAVVSSPVPLGAPIDTNLPGMHTFLVTATDAAGNVGSATVSYTVLASSGVAQPVNSDGSSIFKFGSTVPLKFSLADAAGAPISGLAPKLYLAHRSDGIWGSDMEAVSTSAADTGNTFRETNTGGYVFNLSTKGLATGTWRLRVDLGNGAQLTARFSLK